MFLSVLLVSSLVYPSLCATPPPRLGPAYVAPSDLTSESSLIKQTWKFLESTLNGFISNGSSLGGVIRNLDSYTFSTSAFSIIDTSAADVLQFHHTGADVRNSTSGTRLVNAQSVYRLGSISKVFTVYTTLLSIGPDYWYRPLTDFIPGLLNTGTCQNETTNRTDWCQVTLGAVAGHMGCILRDTASPENDLLASIGAQNTSSASISLPSVNTAQADDNLLCLKYEVNNGTPVCPTSLYLESINQRPPVYTPWMSPSYSNSGLDLLALAVENITGTPFRNLMEEKVFRPLDMSSTYYVPPSDLANAVIPGADTDSFSVDYGSQTPSGGIASTITDMNKLGMAILNSTLLPSTMTAEWLKPITHTSSLRVSVGRPWEIYRLDVDGRTSDLYTKSGGISDYSTYFVLSPDHGAGFTILGASRSGIGNVVAVLTDYLVTNLVLAFERQAARESALKLAGRYTLPNTAANSSIVLAVDSAQGPGLHVTSWILNGTDFLRGVLPAITGGSDSISLLPTYLETQLPNGNMVTAFRASFAWSRLNASLLGPTLQPINGAWSSLDRPLYAGVPIDLFTLTTNATGYATVLGVAALRLNMVRAS